MLTHALQQVAIIVEALLAVALVARLRVHALALLADLCPKQYAFVDVCDQRERECSMASPLPGGLGPLAETHGRGLWET